MLRASTFTCGPGKAMGCLQPGPSEQLSTVGGGGGVDAFSVGALPLTTEAAPLLAESS